MSVNEIIFPVPFKHHAHIFGTFTSFEEWSGPNIPLYLEFNDLLIDNSLKIF